MRQLKINNLVADLGSAVIELTKQSYLFTDFDSRYIPISNSIELPQSQQNTFIFENPGLLASTNRSFQKVYTAEYSDTTLIFKGVAILIESNGSYVIQLIDASFEFWDYLTKSIRTLAKDSDDFVFNIDSYNTLKFETDSIFIWAATNMHLSRISAKSIFNANVNQKLKYSRPLIQVGKIRSRTFEATGWTFEPISIYDNTTKYAISTNHETFFVTSYQKKLNSTYSFTDSAILTGLNTNNFIYHTTAATDFLTVGATKRQFRLRGDVISDVDCTLTVIGTSNPTSTDIIKESFVLSAGTNNVNLFTGNFSTSETNLTIEFLFEANGNANVTFDAWLYDIVSENDFTDLNLSPLENYKVIAYDNTPDMPILTVAKNSFVKNAEYFYTDVFTKKILFFSLASFSKMSALDWSSKFIEGSDIHLGTVGEYAKNNYLVYDNDETIAQTLGRGYFTIDNDFLEQLKELYKSDYSASLTIEIDSFDVADFQIYNNTIRQNKLNKRIVKYELDGTIGSFANFKDMSFANVLQNNYSVLIAALNRTRVVNCQLDLNNSDFYSFDFSVPVYIDKLKSTFFVLSLSNFTGPGLVDAQLLKLA